MTSHARRVWLLRDPQEDDPYECCLRDAGFDPTSHPVLHFEPVNDEALARALSEPRKYGGVILTSPRGAMRFLDDGMPDERWRQKPAFVVGARTGDVLRSAGFDVYGEHTSTGYMLARHIEGDYRDGKPLLFLSGDRRRPELMAYLGRTSVKVEEITVYRTHIVSFDLPVDRPDWLVFFSPSGVEAMGEWRGERIPRLAAIGETTAEALREAGLKVSAVAAEPTPEALCEAIRRHSGGLR